MSRQNDLCNEIVRILKNALVDTTGVAVIVENDCNPSVEVEKALGKYGVLVMVAISGHQRKSTGKLLAEELSFEIIVVENPQKNRLTVGRPTVSSVSEIIRDSLHWQELFGFRLIYNEMNRTDVNDHDYRMVMSFSAEPANVGLLVWGLSDGMQAYGEIIQKRTGRGGEAIFELGRDGKSRFTGVRDPHLTVDLTANVTSSATNFPDLGDTFSCPVDGVDTSFRCTLSEETEIIANGKTIHIAGRTI